jgi:hypothetical protein
MATTMLVLFTNGCLAVCHFCNSCLKFVLLLLSALLSWYLWRNCIFRICVCFVSNYLRYVIFKACSIIYVFENKLTPTIILRVISRCCQ